MRVPATHETFTHAASCSRPAVREFIGHLGDLMLQCDTCRAWAVAAAIQRADVKAQEPPPRRTRLVCRVHYYPVSANGKGCTPCDAQAARRAQTSRRSQRRANERETDQ